MVLNAGGLRSLVTTALLLNQPDPVRLTLLYVRDGRPATDKRLEHCRQQADHYANVGFEEIEGGLLFAKPTDRRADGVPEATLATPRLLMAAMAHAIDRRAQRLAWPIAVDGAAPPMAAAQETQLLLHQLADLETQTAGLADVPELTLPLLSYTDRQLIELGSGLGVPWELAWSCVEKNPAACGNCPACVRRQKAFKSAGVVDPMRTPVARR